MQHQSIFKHKLLLTCLMIQQKWNPLYLLFLCLSKLIKTETDQWMSNILHHQYWCLTVVISANERVRDRKLLSQRCTKRQMPHSWALCGIKLPEKIVIPSKWKIGNSSLTTCLCNQAVNRNEKSSSADCWATFWPYMVWRKRKGSVGWNYSSLASIKHSNEHLLINILNIVLYCSWCALGWMKHNKMVIWHSTGSHWILCICVGFFYVAILKNDFNQTKWLHHNMLTFAQPKVLH